MWLSVVGLSLAPLSSTSAHYVLLSFRRVLVLSVYKAKVLQSTSVNIHARAVGASLRIPGWEGRQGAGIVQTPRIFHLYIS